MECKANFLDNPKEFYEPGQKVKAEILFTVPKTEKINRINCAIMGYAKSKWSEEKGGGQRVETYRACESYFNEVSCLLGDFEDNKTELTAGQHKFDVSYALSSHLPTSFKCKNGSIKYKIRITIDRSWKLNSTYEFPFTVIRPLNLNDLETTVRNPMKEELSKNFKWDFTSESLYMSASIPFRAYVPGQTIDVKIQVNNQSRTHVKEIKCSLKKIIFLHSFRPKKKTKMLIEAEGKVCTDTVPILTVQTFHEQLVVPSLPPNISNCDIIKVSYELRVKAKTSGFSRSPKLKFPITIGTVPLESRGDNIPSSPSCASLPPPSYEEALADGAGNDSSDGEGSFTPRYPVFDYEHDVAASKNSV